MNEHEKALIRNVQTHDLAESLRLRRAQLAQESKLPPQDFALPFPANINAVYKAPSPLAGTLGTVGIGLASAFLGFALAHHFEKTKEEGKVIPPTPLVKESPAIPPVVKPLELQLRWWVDQGELKTRIEEVSP